MRFRGFESGFRRFMVAVKEILGFFSWGFQEVLGAFMRISVGFQRWGFEAFQMAFGVVSGS